ncbi:hypothetical protein PQR75_46690 [Paraburkholderia fungorum]|uniref:hypothetical protein n=1 Tax=Paraburkholderia fungorum TaxID=134537 RepID=UPI0038B72E42
MKIPTITRRTIALSVSFVVLVVGLLHLWLANAWHYYLANHEAITQLGTFGGAALVAWAALRQATTAQVAS